MALISQSLLSQSRPLPFFQGKYQTPLVQPLTHTTCTKRRDFSVRIDMSKRTDSYRNLGELPIYPLPLVLFPGATLPLQICEFRYRIMMNTVLQTDHRFGVLFSNPIPSTTEHFSNKIGCVAEVVKHQRLADGRFFIICKGQERFRIAHIQRTMPYMVSVLTLIEDWPIHPNVVDAIERLASKVEGDLKDFIKLAERLEGKNRDNQDIDDIDFRKGQAYTPFSFFVASCFKESQKEQQDKFWCSQHQLNQEELLEMIDPAMRFVAEREMLKATIKYLHAVIAAKDACSSSSP